MGVAEVPAVSASPPPRPLVSLVVLAATLVTAVSVAIPQSTSPFGGVNYMIVLSGATLVLGVAARLRGERGALGVVALVCAGLAAVLLVLIFVFEFGYGLAMGVAMPD